MLTELRKILKKIRVRIDLKQRQLDNPFLPVNSTILRSELLFLKGLTSDLRKLYKRIQKDLV